MSSGGDAYVGVDLGGTSIMCAAVRDGEVLASSGTKTKPERGPDAVIERIAVTIRDVMKDARGSVSAFRAICVGAPGTIDSVAGVVQRAPNLDWHDVPLARKLENELELPVFLDNDVNVGAVGEHVHGAGRGCLNMVAVFVGTGIGGGVIVEGRPYVGVRGAAAEFGHTVIVPDGRQCGCGRLGCFEAYASKTAMEAMIQERVANGDTSIVPEIMREKRKDRITSSVIERALQQRDAVMIEVLETAQSYLGLLVGNLVNTFDPEMVVFGGGLVERLGTAFVEPIATRARERFIQEDPTERVRIVAGHLGDHAGSIGAAVQAQRRV